MYCKKCGCKIKSEEKYCSDCGAEVGNIEYCGGFWGLVGEEKEKIDIPDIKPVEPEKIIEENKKAALKEHPVSKRKNKRKNRMMYVGIALLIICVIQTIRVSSISRKYEFQKMRYNNLKQNYDELIIEKENIKKEYDVFKQSVMIEMNENAEDIIEGTGEELMEKEEEKTDETVLRKRLKCIDGKVVTVDE